MSRGGERIGTVGWKDGYALVYRAKDLSSVNYKPMKGSHEALCKVESNSNLATKMGAKTFFFFK